MTLTQLIGIGARTPHYRDIVITKPSVGWVEVHSENFFATGGISIQILEEIREIYPISLHGIGLSLGSADGLLDNHLLRLKGLIDRIDPLFVSEHLSWGYVNGVYMPDLLPLPYTKESLDILVDNILKAQDVLQRPLFIENPSSYFEYQSSTLSETDFLAEVCQRSGCALLLDINNIFVSSFNHGWNGQAYIDAIPPHFVKEIHLAGHSQKELPDNNTILIDTHDNTVCDGVWNLYQHAINRFGPTHTLLEWDTNLPPLADLVKEAQKCLPYMLAHQKNKVLDHV